MLLSLKLRILMSNVKILIIFGTRPEAIKLAPLIKLLKNSNKFDVKILVTAQHRQMLDQVLDVFEIKPDYDLNLMKSDQDLTDISSRILEGCRNIFTHYKPTLVIVHGDTTTTFASSLSAFYHQIDVAHVEAGLRTFNMYSPFPEEMNRVMTSKIAKFHFSPTQESAENLLREGHAIDSILVTGNTVIDSLFEVIEKIKNDSSLKNKVEENLKKLIPDLTSKKIVLITGHRRENFGLGLKNICESLSELASKFPDVNFIYPVHMNPNVQKTVKDILGSKNNIFLIEPLEYLPFVHLMSLSYLILTDSGGIQEEAPSLRKPVLVTRETTERPEAVNANVVKLVGTDKQKIIAEVTDLLTSELAYKRMSGGANPYGDGKASIRILEFLESVF